jgi:hypothetical protein
MAARLHWVMALLGLLALPAAFVGSVAAKGGSVLATVDRPAVVMASPAAAERGAIERNVGEPRVIVTVTGFQPAHTGAVQAVVKALLDGTEQEIGRFGIVPHAAFKAAEPSQAQSFSLPLPKGLATGGSVRLNVYLVPSTGDGKGARLEVGGAEIQ